MPQGYIRGSYFFLIYSNDIINSCNLLSFVLFTGDFAVDIHHDSIDSVIHPPVDCESSIVVG